MKDAVAIELRCVGGWRVQGEVEKLSKLVDIVVVDSPHYAVSDHEGRLVLAGVPAGPQRYHAWRPGAADVTGTVVVDGTSTLELTWPAR